MNNQQQTYEGEIMATSGTLLSLILQAAVPLYILQLQQQGGPQETDLDAALAYSEDLGAHGDRLLFGSKQPGEVARLFNGLAHAIAVLSFCPGGVRGFGHHWESTRYGV